MRDNESKNALSLFNGMGCLWIACELAGIKINKRYSSEIEKYPNQANNAMFPDTEQIGDVRNVDVSNIEFIDLLAGGSPCQSFSFAGKRKGMAAKTDDKELIEILTLNHYLQLKSEQFEFEGQSYLFWEYIRILTEIKKYNPNVKFLLENVNMSKKWQKVITQAIGIKPIRINANLVSAQNRDRLFWTNIFTEQKGLFGDLECNIPQPQDQNIFIKDIIEKPEHFENKFEFKKYIKKYILSKKSLEYLEKRTIENKKKGRGFGAVYPKENEKSSCIDSRYGALRNSGESYLIMDDDLVLGCDFRTDEGIRIRKNGKSGTLAAMARNDESCGQLVLINKTIRRFTPRECGRLQSIPEEKLNIILNCGISDTQLYKMFGNGWNIKVIEWILQHLKK